MGSYPKLSVMERTIAGILKCVPHFLRQLRRKASRLQAVADHGGTAIDRLKCEVCKAMLNLLRNWCPLVLYCRLLVRQCKWSGRHPETAIDAQNVLRPVFVLLIELRRAAAEPVVTSKICLSRSALRELTDVCWLVVCPPTSKPRSDSACTRMLLTTAREFGTVLGSRVRPPSRDTGRLMQIFRPTLTASWTGTHTELC